MNIKTIIEKVSIVVVVASIFIAAISISSTINKLTHYALQQTGSALMSIVILGFMGCCFIKNEEVTKKKAVEEYKEYQDRWKDG